MNDEHIEKMLAPLEGLDAPKHRTALRGALMREHARARRPYFALRIPQFITMKTALIPISSFAVLALVAIGTFGVTQKSVSAQEVAQRAMTAASRLTPEIREKLEAQMKADMMQTLKEAYAAPDLRILTREEYEKEAPFTMASSAPAGATISMARNVHAIRTTGEPTEISGEAGSFTVSSAPMQWQGTAETGVAPAYAVHEINSEAPVTVAFQAARAMPIEATADVTFTAAAAPGDAKFTAGTLVGDFNIKQPVKYLRYTDPEGRKVTLGLDDTDTPVFRIEELIATDIEHMPDGSIGIQGKVLHQVEIHTQNMDGGFGTAGAVKVGE